jgi:hypothetical protein
VLENALEGEKGIMNMNKKLTLTLLIGFSSTLMALAQAPYDQYLLAWTGTGYTTNSHGKLAATSITGHDFVIRVAQDNFPDNWASIVPQLCLVYRAEKRDIAVVYRSTGEFVADVYQMEYSFTDVTNPTDTTTYRQAFLNDEYHTSSVNGYSGEAFGSTFGIETKTVNKLGNIASYYYHGTFQYAMSGPPTPLDPEVNTVWVGSFYTGARVPYKGSLSSLKPSRSHAAFQVARRTFRRGGELLRMHRLAST